MLGPGRQLPPAADLGVRAGPVPPSQWRPRWRSARSRRYVELGAPTVALLLALASPSLAVRSALASRGPAVRSALVLPRPAVLSVPAGRRQPLALPTTFALRPELAPTGPWPEVVAQAMAYVEVRASVRLEAPRELPPAGLVPNSAQVSASTTRYAVALYHCVPALPVDHAGIGVGSCGAMANYYGHFEGRSYRAPAAALASLHFPAPSCPHQSAVVLAGGVVATLYSAPWPEGNCEVTWRAGHWSFMLNGDLNGGTHGDHTVPWRQVADETVSYLRGRSLPGAHGYMESDIAADGLHTSTFWQLGRFVYGAGTYHGAVPALALAMAMAPYPGASRPRPALSLLASTSLASTSLASTSRGGAP